MKYKEYILSDDWQRLRIAAIKRDGYKCCCCNKQCDENGAGLQVHHLRYPRDFKDDCLTNVITLCKIHHAARHGFKNQFRHISKVIDIVLVNIEHDVHRIKS